MIGRRALHKWIGIGGVAVVLAGAGAAAWRRNAEPARAPAPPPAVPVTVVATKQEDVPIFLSGPGTVSAWNTISIHSLVNGTLQSVNFTQGQEVRRGDILAVIDPRTFQAALDQAQAKKAQDESQLVDDQKDLQRFKAMAAQAFQTQQNLDQQQAKVGVDQATIQADQAAIEGAQTQLSYATIRSPIDGVTGFRQLDPGNIIHTTDANPLTVITQVEPVQVTFTLPQRNLGEVREAMLAGPVPVLAFDQDNAHELAAGELMLVNNQINQTTSTISLRAKFANADRKLWPGEFVRIRIQVATRKGAIVIPPVAVQRDPDGLYTWVVASDDKVDRRRIETTPVDTSTTVVTKGLEAGENVVVNGQYRLEPGTRVDAVGPRTAGLSDHAS